MPIDTPMPPTAAPPADSPQTIARQLPPTKRAIEARQGGWIDFLQGIPVLARFKKSMRVGSGSTALAAFDGLDGVVSADGTQAALFSRDRADSSKYFAWYENGTIRLLSQQGGDIWTINPTTGIFTLAWTVISAFTSSWVDATAATGAPTVRYRKDLFGNVQLVGSIKSGTVGSAAFTLPVGFRPIGTLPLPGVDANATTTMARFDVQAGGAVIPQGGSNVTGLVFNFIFPTV